MPSQPTLGELNLRKPWLNDGQAVHRLIQECPPLDCNSPYCYFLLNSHFAHTCVVAEQGAKIGGFLSAYFRPDAPHTLFVWQVAVHESLRNQGMARLMLDSLLSRPECGHARWLEATVGPSNIASRSLFSGYARSVGAELTESDFLGAEAFGGEQHEPEILLRIGPLDAAGK
jgi:L-2,4-diaminobutyric acid acetyltransferase